MSRRFILTLALRDALVAVLDDRWIDFGDLDGYGPSGARNREVLRSWLTTGASPRRGGRYVQVTLGWPLTRLLERACGVVRHRQRTAPGVKRSAEALEFRLSMVGIGRAGAAPTFPRSAVS